MTYQVDVNALVTFEDRDEALVTAEILRKIVGSRKAVRFLASNGHVMVQVPDVEKFDMSKATRGGQEADGLAGSVARKLNQALSTSSIVPVRVLDEDTRTWGVDYAAMLNQVRELENAPENSLTVFKEVVAQVLADTATRGLK